MGHYLLLSLFNSIKIVFRPIWWVSFEFLNQIRYFSIKYLPIVLKRLVGYLMCITKGLQRIWEESFLAWLRIDTMAGSLIVPRQHFKTQKGYSPPPGNKQVNKWAVSARNSYKEGTMLHVRDVIELVQVWFSLVWLPLVQLCSITKGLL